MKFTNLFHVSVLASLVAAGCKPEDPPTAPPPPAPKAPEAVVATPPVASPGPAAPVTPPPVGGAAAAAPAAPEAEPKEIKTIDGKTISAIQYVQSLADSYERTRAGQSDGTPWPPLTDLQLLVNVGMVKRLPTPPAGQKFVFDAKTGKVTLAPN
jgi:hypothetical protein